MVRAKVSLLSQAPESEYSKYLDYAEGVIDKFAGKLIITHGVSGSGKSIVSKAIANQIQGLVIRADIERKRLFPGANRYSDEATEKTYQHLLDASLYAALTGFNVLVDATFLVKNLRERFSQAAHHEQLEFTILSCHASGAVCCQRIEQREEKDVDPSEATVAVLKMQQKSQQPLDEDEQQHCIELDTEKLSVEQCLVKTKNYFKER